MDVNHQKYQINAIMNDHYWRLIAPILLRIGLVGLFVGGEYLLRSFIALPVYIDYVGTPSSFADDIINPQPLSLLITFIFGALYLLLFPPLSQGAKSSLFKAAGNIQAKGLFFWFIPKYWLKSIWLRIRVTIWPLLLFLSIILLPMYIAPILIGKIALPVGLSGDLLRLAFWILGFSAAFMLCTFFLGLCSRWFLAPFILGLCPDMPLKVILKKSAQFSKGKRFWILSYRLSRLGMLLASLTILPAFYLLPRRSVSLALFAEELIENEPQLTFN